MSKLFSDFSNKTYCAKNGLKLWVNLKPTIGAFEILKLDFSDINQSLSFFEIELICFISFLQDLS